MICCPISLIMVMKPPISSSCEQRRKLQGQQMQLPQRCNQSQCRWCGQGSVQTCPSTKARLCEEYCWKAAWVRLWVKKGSQSQLSEIPVWRSNALRSMMDRPLWKLVNFQSGRSWSPKPWKAYLVLQLAKSMCGCRISPVSNRRR